jgi:NTE family protein
MSTARAAVAADGRMRHPLLFALLLAACAALVAGCATRPVLPPLATVGADEGYRIAGREAAAAGKDNLVVLAFSGGGTRAAAFSFGVLEYLRRTEIAGPDGKVHRLLDDVDVVTGVSGGSFTALAYGLYGDRLFDEYEARFLRRDVQGEILARTFDPTYWGRLWSSGWGRSELAAELYDEILFEGATYGDLARRRGPLILASATDISTGARFEFSQQTFDILCSDLHALRLSRAAAASSAVPVVLSPVTIDNRGGSCGASLPAWAQRFVASSDPPRPAARAIRTLKSLEAYADGARRPYIHLVDGGVSDNLGMRGVLDALALMEALYDAGAPNRLDRVRRVVVIIVNSMSTPATGWDRSEAPPGPISVLLQASGVPIDHYSYEAIELLKDTAARWRTMRIIRDSAAMKANTDPVVAAAVRAPDTAIYAIDVSFAALADPAERAYLNQQPTSFFLPDEAVDRLRAAAGTILAHSPEFRRLLDDLGARIVDALPPAAGRAR